MTYDPHGVTSDPQMQIYCYEDDLFDSLDHALKEGGRITAIAVLFQVCVYVWLCL